MQHPKKEKGLMHQRGWQLPVFLQQRGNACWFFSFMGKLDNVKWTGQGGRRTRGKWWMQTSYWWKYACLLFLRSTQNFNIRAFLITSVHFWKLKLCSTQTLPQESCAAVPGSVWHPWCSTDSIISFEKEHQNGTSHGEGSWGVGERHEHKAWWRHRAVRRLLL